VIYIDVNVPDAVKSLGRVARQQVPFATALALTWTAADAQAAVRDALPGKFTIRNTWVDKGIRILPAHKASWPNMSARIYSRDDFMARQEFGGVKVPRGHDLAIPMPEMLARVGGKRGIIRKRNRPKAILNTRRKGIKPFVATMPDGTHGIFVRRNHERLPIDMLYALVPRAPVKPRWDFEPTVREQVQRQFERHFGRALARALASRRT